MGWAQGLGLEAAACVLVEQLRKKRKQSNPCTPCSPRALSAGPCPRRLTPTGMQRRSARDELMAHCPNCHAALDPETRICAGCGASFEDGSSWKPCLDDERVRLRASDDGMTWYAALLYLSLPVWGLFAGLAMLSLLPRGRETDGGIVVFLGALAPCVGATPIFRRKASGTLEKLIIFVVYYVACAFTMFVVGWVSLGIFGLVK